MEYIITCISHRRAENIEKIIVESTHEILQTKKIPDTVYLATDNLGEIIEKLVILHIRTWMLEDLIQSATSSEEIADLKKKIDICFKIKRPKFVQAINTLIEQAVITGTSLQEDSVKLYKNINE